MSASLLREAAALMRERAEAATPGPWGFGGSGVGTLYVDGDLDGAWRYQDEPEHPHRAICGTDCPADDEPLTASLRRSRSNGEHIASWHPAVALAVADWLDAEAAAVESLAQAGIDRQFDEAWVARETASRHGHALTVARTYLGRDA